MLEHSFWFHKEKILNFELYFWNIFERRSCLDMSAGLSTADSGRLEQCTRIWLADQRRYKSEQVRSKTLKNCIDPWIKPIHTETTFCQQFHPWWCCTQICPKGTKLADFVFLWWIISLPILIKSKSQMICQTNIKFQPLISASQISIGYWVFFSHFIINIHWISFGFELLVWWHRAF